MIKRVKIFFVFLFFCFMFFAAGQVRAQEVSSANNAFSGIVKIKLFTVTEDGFLINVSVGSGAIIDPSGIILTNYHVISAEEDYDQSQRKATYQVCLTTSMNKEPECKYSARLLASDKDKDIALLKIKNISGLSSDASYSYLGISDQVMETGESVTVLGYPNVGGDTITSTQGVVSGKTNKYDMDWIKTDADISFGNSGGAAIDSSGKIIGVTTMSHSDMLSSMGYLVDIKYVNAWINANKSKAEQTSVLENRLIDFTKKEYSLKASNVFSQTYPAFSVTKPADWDFVYSREDNISIHKEDDENSGSFSLSLFKFPFLVQGGDIENIFKMNNLIFLSFLNIVKSEDVKIGGKNGKKITYSLMGSVEKTYYIPHGEYMISISSSYGKNDKDKEAIESIINSVVLNNYSSQLAAKKVLSNSYHGFSLNLGSSDWLVQEMDSVESPIVLYNNENRGASINFTYQKRTDDTLGLSNNELYNIELQETEDAKTMLKSGGIDINIIEAKSYANVGNFNNAVNFGVEMKKDNETLLRSSKNSIYFKDYILSIELVFFGPWEDYEEVKESFEEIMDEFKVNGYSPINITEKVLVYSEDGDDDGAVSVNIGDGLEVGIDKEGVKVDIENGLKVNTKNGLSVSAGDETGVSINNSSMHVRLKGKIVLKVEDAGKAYYIHPSLEKMYYLGKPDDAFSVMREQGVGITNKDLYKIPVGVNPEGHDSDNDGLSDYLEDALGLDSNNSDTDGDGHQDKVELENHFSPWGEGKQNIDTEFAAKQSGKILLQVEKNGEAWYINPKDGKRYFLGRPADAFSVMRNLGLGISNDDFENL